MPDDDLKTGPEKEYELWSLEIRRGALSLAILTIILEGESYGYDIMKKLSQEPYDSLQVEPSTTYPLLRRLEKRGILEGRWSDASGKRRRLYYVTRDGRRILRRMVKSWAGLNDQLKQLIKEAGLNE
jgi:PadR family transcriptional regulator PadR